MVSKAATSILVVCVLFYGGATLFLYTSQEALLFFPRAIDPKQADRFSESLIEIEHEGVVLKGWFVPKTANEEGNKKGIKERVAETIPETISETIVYYGGNGEEMSRSLSRVLEIGDYNFLLMNYRGYGESGGTPSEVSLKSDAIFILQTLSESKRISLSKTHVIGRSLGTGIAVHVAASLSVASLTLISPYDSIVSVAKAQYPIFPVRQLLRHPFDTLKDAPAVVEKTLVFKAAQDLVVPHENTDQLLEEWTAPLHVVTLPNTDHNHVFTETFYSEISQFLAHQSR